MDIREYNGIVAKTRVGNVYLRYSVVYMRCIFMVKSIVSCLGLYNSVVLCNITCLNLFSSRVFVKL